jgi:predicted AlkP superfamily pyrophosphatase or phosphodiesterase
LSREGSVVYLGYRVAWRFAPAKVRSPASVLSPGELQPRLESILHQAVAKYTLLEIYRTRIEDVRREVAASFRSLLQESGYDAGDIFILYAIRPEARDSIHAYDLAQARANPTRVIFIGVDSATWRVIAPLMREGHAPAFAHMVQGGAHGTLLSQAPYFTPVIWTTIATGKTPDQHGITSFTVQNPETGKRVPISSNYRRVPALWNMLSAYGKTAGVIGWWVTWPSERISGFLCSDYTWPILKGGDGKFITYASGLDVPARTYPDSLIADVREYLVNPDQSRDRMLGMLGLDEIPTLESPENPPLLDATFARDESYTAMAFPLMRQYRPGFLAVYYEGSDVISHWFWQLYEYYRWKTHGERTIFEMDLDPVTSQDYLRYGRAVERYYEHQDAVLSRFLATMDSNTILVVASDHGYGANEKMERIYVGDDQFKVPIHWHKPEGVVILYGKNIRAGATIRGATVLDLVPTLLYLMGLPLAPDLQGKVLREAIDPAYLDKHPFVWIDSYDGLWKPERKPGPLETGATAGVLELLRSLGYVE